VEKALDRLVMHPPPIAVQAIAVMGVVLNVIRLCLKEALYLDSGWRYCWLLSCDGDQKKDPNNRKRNSRNRQYL